MRAKARLSYYCVPRNRFELLPQVFDFGQYRHAPASDGQPGSAWFTVPMGDTELTFFLDSAELERYRADKCLD